MTSRRIARTQDLAAATFRHYHSQYRRDAREQGVESGEGARYRWLTTVPRESAIGAGLLAFAGAGRAPVDLHDAALRVLAQYAPGLQMDVLALRAQFVAVMAAAGRRAPYSRLCHI